MLLQYYILQINSDSLLKYVNKLNIITYLTHYTILIFVINLFVITLQFIINVAAMSSLNYSLHKLAHYCTLLPLQDMYVVSDFPLRRILIIHQREF